jgi:hypothetical protein
MKLLVLKKFRDLKVGVIRQPDFVFEATEVRFEELQTNLGDGFVVPIQIIEVETKTPHEEDKGEITGTDEGTSSEFPKHVGGGHYELSNGEKVKGKDEAQKAEAALEE